MPTWRWDPERVVLMDLETQSAADLRKLGSRAYLRDSSTRLLSAVFLVEGCLEVWIPEGRAPSAFDGDALAERLATDFNLRCDIMVQDDAPSLVCAAIDRGHTFVAHNAENFDAIAWERFVPDLRPTWYDTIHCCRAGGLPAGLDKASKMLGGPGKDEHGGKVMKMLTRAKPGRAGGIAYPVGTAPLWEQLIRYNIIDVLELKRVYEATREYGEPDVLAMHQAVNDRGVAVDLAFARRLHDLWHQAKAAARDEVESLTEKDLNGDDVYSTKKVKAWLATQGLVLPSLERKQVQALMQDPEGFFGDAEDPTVQKVTAVIKARQTAASATVGKVERVLRAADPDHRIRGCLVYHGAHTGRWSGRDLQPHNFPRGAGKLDVDALLARQDAGGLVLADVEAAAKAASCSVGDALATLMRPVVTAAEGKLLCIVDYAAVEARGTAWIAGDEEALAAFEDPRRCIYCDMASEVFGQPVTKKEASLRQVGKVIILGCGYQMGAAKFEATCGLSGVDFAAVGLTGEACVKAYRGRYRAIARAWRNLGDAAMQVAAGGGSAFTNKVEFIRDGRDLLLRLPSNRVLTYRMARVEMLPPRWAPDAPPQPALLYRSGHGYDKALYGGLLMENIVQAHCRDLMAHALVRLAGHCYTVLHVHDEAVDEAPEQEAEAHLHRMGRVMSDPPRWASTFPLRVEGFVSKRYVKKAPAGAPQVDYMRGKQL